MVGEERGGNSAGGEVAVEAQQPEGVLADHQEGAQLAQETGDVRIILQKAGEVPAVIHQSIIY